MTHDLMLERARRLRRDATPFEQSLWRHLRAGRFAGFKFRRQHVLGHYILDFVCIQAKLIIELDGSQHAGATAYDAQRDAWLRGQGFQVLRIWNNEWQQQPEAVLERLWQMLNAVRPGNQGRFEKGEGVGSTTPPSPLVGEGPGERGDLAGN